MYVWNWDHNNQLYLQGSDEPVELSDRQKSLIEQLAKSTVFGKTQLFLENALAQDKDFKKLSERLDLDFSNIEIEKQKGLVERLLQ